MGEEKITSHETGFQMNKLSFRKRAAVMERQTLSGMVPRARVAAQASEETKINRPVMAPAPDSDKT